MFFDDTCGGKWGLPGLSASWLWGGRLYRGLGRLDACQGVSTWVDALDWLNSYESSRLIAEIQFWGHGRWGGLYLEEDVLQADALCPGHPVHERLLALKPRMRKDGSSLWWFRSCDTVGSRVGHEFAREWSRFFNCRVAGHTHQILFWQSGLQLLEAGREPSWPEEEGVVENLEHAAYSSWRAPRTICCLQNEITWEA
jgi:hypothetical protein